MPTLYAGPGAVSALQDGEQTLGTKCECAEYGNCFGNAVGLPSKDVGQHSDEHHTECFDAETGA